MESWSKRHCFACMAVSVRMDQSLVLKEDWRSLQMVLLRFQLRRKHCTPLLRTWLRFCVGAAMTAELKTEEMQPGSNP